MNRVARDAAVLISIVIGVACTACTSDAGSSASGGSPRSSTAASSTGSSTTAHVPPPPKVGQCRNTPARVYGRDDWVDQSPVVDCSKRHSLETVGVIKPVEKLTLAAAKQLRASCESPLVAYLGIGSPELRTIVGPVGYWPSRAQRAAGQNWLRCDVGVQATTHCCSPQEQLAPQTESLRGDVGADPVRFRWCLDQLPDPARSQPLTSCKKPHRTEILPDGLQLTVTHYPSAAALSRKGHADCAALVSARGDRASLVVTPVWQPRASFSGGTLFGTCWVHRKAGLMPPAT